MEGVPESRPSVFFHELLGERSKDTFGLDKETPKHKNGEEW